MDNEREEKGQATPRRLNQPEPSLRKSGSPVFQHQIKPPFVHTNYDSAISLSAPLCAHPNGIPTKVAKFSGLGE